MKLYVLFMSSFRDTHTPRVNGQAQPAGRTAPASIPFFALRKRAGSERGVALVITLILLSIITFMTVTFLVVSRRERERSATSITQTVAKSVLDGGNNFANAHLMSVIMGTTNTQRPGLIVSTNYVSARNYFISGNNSVTNVSYNDQAGNALPVTDLQQNLNNLLFSPRAPVFFPSRIANGPAEFRYYLDLNRNGVYDTNGWGTFYNTNGQPIGLPLSHFFVGDPEWIGILDRPEYRHSGSNLFVGRFCYLIQPIGNSLDINYIHNEAKLLGANNPNGYLRNQGVGTWEMNLAAFLGTLNTNTWPLDQSVNGNAYKYLPFANSTASIGLPFQDAANILQYRYASNYLTLSNVTSGANTALFGTRGGQAIATDGYDSYSSGPLMTGIWPLATDPDTIRAVSASSHWSGADNVNTFFGTQDLFNTNSGFLNTFSKHLLDAGLRTNSSYDRYTFYNLLGQMGMGSAAEPLGKINLNYNNLGSLQATNFIGWTPTNFFLTTANQLLKNAGFPFGVTNIPVLLNGTNLVYTPAVHRLLQLAANIYDASTNRFLPNSISNTYPTVFRPTFTNDTVRSNIYINGYVEVGANNDYLSIPLVLPAQAGQVNSSTVNIYGVPWIIGAKKGLPNFNELALAAYPQITRKLQIVKPDLNSKSVWQTNVQYIVGISNAIGVEAWNSYTNPYPRDVEITARHDITMYLWVTNQPGQPGKLLTSIITNYANTVTIPANTWTGLPNNPSAQSAAAMASFKVPLLTNLLFVTDSIYQQNPAKLIPVQTFPNTDIWEKSITLQPPQFILGVTNRLRFIMRDVASGRILDYVHLSGLDTLEDLSQDVNLGDTLKVWTTNSVKASDPKAVPVGIKNQIGFSSGDPGLGKTDWSNNSLESFDTKQAEISKFNDFLNKSQSNTNLIMQAPFTPSTKTVLYFSWQANDPLVHYTVGDLTSYPRTNSLTKVTPPNTTRITNSLPNIYRINDRYQPWGGNPVNSSVNDTNKYNLAVKDPLVRRSDDWNFPTNKFPNIGWLGRVHRGTPWQTVYLKSTPVGAASWQYWSGNPYPVDAGISMPTNDWRLLDLFTVAQNENASRGQLSINQTNPAAWHALLDGVVLLTNSMPDAQLNTSSNGIPYYDALVVDPLTNAAAINRILAAINDVRSTNTLCTNMTTGQIARQNTFTGLGQILATPELTVASPFLLTTNLTQATTGIRDEVYERIPQQLLSLMKVGENRYVVYTWAQSLRPAQGAIVQSSGPYFGMPTNYVVTGEMASRSLIKVVNPPIPGSYRITNNPPARIVVESYNILPPE